MPAGSDGITVDTRQLSDLARYLKTHAEKDLRRELLKRIRLAAKPVKDAIAAEASWSTRIPAALAIRSSYAARGASVKVIVDAAKAPEGRPLNNRDRDGTFRHPVFGNRDNWVSEQARPFMRRGAEVAAPLVEREVEKVYEDIKNRAGF